MHTMIIFTEWPESVFYYLVPHSETQMLADIREAAMQGLIVNGRAEHALQEAICEKAFAHFYDAEGEKGPIQKYRLVFCKKGGSESIPLKEPISEVLSRG